jgi:hypothetical protein
MKGAMRGVMVFVLAATGLSASGDVPVTAVRVARTVVVTLPPSLAEVGGRPSLAWLSPPACDAEGNVFLAPLSGPERGSAPDALVRLGADGAAGAIDLPTGAGPGPRNIRLGGTAVAPGGVLHVLASLGGDRDRRRVLLGFDQRGAAPTTIELGDLPLTVEAFAPFGSGDVLVAGPDHAARRPRLAVWRGAGVLRDVDWSVAPDFGPERWLMQAMGGDRVLAVAAPDRTAFVIAPDGRIDRQFTLAASPVPGLALAGLWVSGDRVAALYQGKPPGGGDVPTRIVVVHDLVTGQSRAVYGPLPHALMCYRATEEGDEFTMFSMAGGTWRLITASSG